MVQVDFLAANHVRIVGLVHVCHFVYVCLCECPRSKENGLSYETWNLVHVEIQCMAVVWHARYLSS